MLTLVVLCLLGRTVHGKSQEYFPNGFPSFRFQSVADVDCQVRYGELTHCSVTCGDGYSILPRYIVRPAQGRGRPCPPLDDIRVSCHLTPCPPVGLAVRSVDCKIGEGEWSHCSTTCGQGSQHRLDFIIVEAANGGIPCPKPDHLHHYRSCNTGPCSATSQHRTPTTPRHGTTTNSDVAVSGNQPLEPGDDEINKLEKGCKTHPSGPLSPCSVSCGGGIMSRPLSIVREPIAGGSLCPDPLVEVVACNVEACPDDGRPVDCEWSWGPWSSCSKRCSQTGTRTRTAFVMVDPKNGGKQCPPPLDLVQKDFCPYGYCPSF